MHSTIFFFFVVNITNLKLDLVSQFKILNDLTRYTFLHLKYKILIVNWTLRFKVVEN